MNACFDKFIVYPMLKKTEKEDDRAGLSSGKITQITPGRRQWEGVSSPFPPHLYPEGDRAPVRTGSTTSQAFVFVFF